VIEAGEIGRQGSFASRPLDSLPARIDSQHDRKLRGLLSPDATAGDLRLGRVRLRRREARDRIADVNHFIDASGGRAA
jgi:hypothetical protein